MNKEYLIAACIGSITTIICTIITSIWNKQSHQNKLNKVSIINKSKLFLELQQTCGTIKKDIDANAVYIAYFHNGDYYKNGLSIDKFSVVAEDYDECITFNNTSYIRSYQNTSIQQIIFIYHKLLSESRYYIHNTNNTNTTIDSIFYKDLLCRNVKSSYMFLIKNEDDKPIGFIACEYTTPCAFNKEKETYIWKHQILTFNNITKLYGNNK